MGGVNLVSSMYVHICVCYRGSKSEILKAGAEGGKRQRGISWSVNLRGWRDGPKIEGSQLMVDSAVKSHMGHEQSKRQ